MVGEATCGCVYGSVYALYNECCGGDWCVWLSAEEKQLKQRIRELTRYRKNGISKTEGGCKLGG